MRSALHALEVVDIAARTARRGLDARHGGTVVVESQVGEGSRFVVELPRDPRLVEGTPAAERADVASAAAAGSL